MKKTRNLLIIVGLGLATLLSCGKDPVITPPEPVKPVDSTVVVVPVEPKPDPTRKSYKYDITIRVAVKSDFFIGTIINDTLDTENRTNWKNVSHTILDGTKDKEIKMTGYIYEGESMFIDYNLIDYISMEGKREQNKIEIFLDDMLYIDTERGIRNEAPPMTRGTWTIIGRDYKYDPEYPYYENQFDWAHRYRQRDNSFNFYPSWRQSDPKLKVLDVERREGQSFGTTEPHLDSYKRRN